MDISSDSQNMSRNGERKPNNNYNCCVKPILTPDYSQMTILPLLGASLLGKKAICDERLNVLTQQKKIHAGAAANQKINFRRPNLNITIDLSRV